MTTIDVDDHPSAEVDLYSPEVVADPFATLDGLRRRAAAVHVPLHDFRVLTRYDDVRAATAGWETFSSAQGVALMDASNADLVGSVLASDPPEHDQLRAVPSEKLAPRALSKVRADVRAYADQLVEEVVARERFDAVVDVSRVFPVNVVSDLVGLPHEGGEKLHRGADATFAGFGPFTPYLQQRMGDVQGHHAWMLQMTDRSRLPPGGWGEVVMDAVDDGRLTEVGALKTMSAYMTAGMDTTVNAIGALLRLFADSPQLHRGAANRDPDHYPDPDRFDLRRNPLDHVAFGYGVHACAGQGLARMEAVTLMEAFIDRVERFELTGPVVRGGNPVVRSLDSVPLAVSAAAL